MARHRRRDQQSESRSGPGETHTLVHSQNPSAPSMLEALRHFVNSRELAGAEPLPRRIAMTSSFNGDGVTTLSGAFADALEKEFQSLVCLVDLSWLGKDPSGATTDRGIRDVLRGDCDLGEVLVVGDDPNITLLHEGTNNSDPPAMSTRSGDLDELVEVLAADFDHVIFDMPPVLESSAVLPLFRLADAYVLVARAGVTQSDELGRVTRQLAELPLLCSVLNRQKSKVSESLRVGRD